MDIIARNYPFEHISNDSRFYLIYQNIRYNKNNWCFFAKYRSPNLLNKQLSVWHEFTDSHTNALEINENGIYSMNFLKNSVVRKLTDTEVRRLEIYRGF